jgi:PEP-CTERM motif
MFTRLSLAVAVSILFLSQRPAGADPLTYDFTGVFQGAGVNGSRQLSGSFTIDSNPTPSSYDSSTENGSSVSITVNAGGQVYNFVNTLQNPNIAAFTAYNWPTGSPPNPTNNSLIEYMWQGSTPSLGSAVNFSMTFYDAGGSPQLLSNVTNFNYVLPSGSFNFGGTAVGSTQGGVGSITSISQVATPEPSTLVTFAMLGIAALARRGFKRRLAACRPATVGSGTTV